MAQIMEKWTAEEIQAAFDDNTQRSGKIIKMAIPYLVDFIAVLEGESAGTYYSLSQNKVINIQELKDLRNFLINETYGIKDGK